MTLVRAVFRKSLLDESLLQRNDELVKAKVIVMPKAAVLDPQGNAVRDAMRHLGMPEIKTVRIGKYMEIEIEGQNRDVESRLHRLCRDLLSNPVIEDYELQQGASQGEKTERTLADPQMQSTKTKRNNKRSR